MADWFRKSENDSNPEDMEDFVLLRQDAEEPEKEGIDTSMDDTGEIPSIYDEMLVQNPDVPEEMMNEYDLALQDEEETTGHKKRNRLILGSIAIVAAIALILASFWGASVLSNPLRGYVQAEVLKGSVIHSIDVSGTLEANARYEITSLVPGKIVSSAFEAGEEVPTGAILYQLDDTDAKLALERAKNQLSRAKAAGSASASNTERIYATDTGTIHTVNIRSGSNVSYGQVVATIKRADDSVVAVTSQVAGTVTTVYISQGKSVSINSLIASVRSTEQSNAQATGVYDQKSSALDVEAAEAYLENYTIKSPISGVIVEKTAKVGDNVDIADTDKPMMVILDTNSLKFSFRVDEHTVRDLELGMKAVVKTDSLPSKTFAGEVTRISAEGIPNENGGPLFEVDVTVKKPGDLKPGMKVTAQVVLGSAINTVCVPRHALMEPDGETAMVLVKDTPASSDIPTLDTTNPELVDESLDYPWIRVPEGCRLVRVSYGVCDGVNVEIIAGLEAGEIVAFDPERELPDLNPEEPEEEKSLEEILTELEEEKKAPAKTPAPTDNAPNASATPTATAPTATL